MLDLFRIQNKNRTGRVAPPSSRRKLSAVVAHPNWFRLGERARTVYTAGFFANFSAQFTRPVICITTNGSPLQRTKRMLARHVSAGYARP
jgi:hypothetical protein